jgi:hypothetical protein
MRGGRAQRAAETRADAMLITPFTAREEQSAAADMALREQERAARRETVAPGLEQQREDNKRTQAGGVHATS